MAVRIVTLTLFVALLLTVVVAPQAQAWSATVDRQIVENAIWLMPQSLRGILVDYRKQVFEGFDEARAELPGPDLIWSVDRGAGVGPEKLQAAVEAAVEQINTQRPFWEMAKTFGRIAYLVSELNNPLRIDDSDRYRTVYYPDFLAYMEGNLPVLAFGFDGFRTDLLAGLGAADFGREVARRAKPLAGLLAQNLVQDGKILPMQGFGPQSLPFGVAAIAYSRSVNDVADLWVAVWRQVNGDLSNPQIK